MHMHCLYLAVQVDSNERLHCDTVQVATDIALHHNILRSRLKVNMGYEITTEGDSFKCAFHTPEDAICWAVMVQVGSHLAGRAWSAPCRLQVTVVCV